MAQVIQCDRCKKLVEPLSAYHFSIDRTTYDLCESCANELERFMKLEEDKADECSV